MLILGLDPGSINTGYGVVDCQGDRLQALAFGRLSCPRGRPLAVRLRAITQELEEIIERWGPDSAVLEAPFHGVNSRSLIVLAQARGALLVTLAARGLEPVEYSPAEVKTAVTGNGRADKTQVARMVKLLLGLEAPRVSHDATDALALAICAARRVRFEELERRAGAKET
ncbi:MAG TPA: crossover junction endodeoxyribonuclease RuvC [Thermoanaerobaculia bacterium]|nr:crossover junction endodeoxyribonuclease RuvC [Thermoanaerobaculia bacterium]